MEYGASTYGDRIAGVYDDLYQTMFDVEGTVDLLADLAGKGPALELGVGTGRIALPLKERGVEVHGVDASRAMVDRMRAKPGGEDIQVFFGDFVDPPVEGRYTLVYVPFNTFFGLLDQDDQVRCFRNVAGLLEDGGTFCLDAFVPDPTRFDRGQHLSCEGVEDGRVEITATRHDPVTQTSTSYHLFISESGIEMFPVKIRYAYPQEMDLMGRLAGLRLRNRWASYRREPFTSASASHVSVYERAPRDEEIYL